MRVGRHLLVLTATLALMGGFAAAARAGTPEWFECVKQKAAPYSKFCGAEGGKGGYLARPGVGAQPFKAYGLVTIGGPRNPITCKMTVEGTKELPNLIRGVGIRLEVCIRAGSRKYHCEGQEPGGPKEKVLESEPLEGELGYISHSPLEVGFRLTNAAAPGAPIFPRVYCIGPVAHFRLSAGSVVGQLAGVVNVSGTKGTIQYLPGPYLGEGQPLVNPPLEGEEPGTLIEELQSVKEVFGEPEPASLKGTLKVPGPLMVRA